VIDAAWDAEKHGATIRPPMNADKTSSLCAFIYVYPPPICLSQQPARA